MTKLEDEVDALLKRLGVPAFFTTFERTHEVSSSGDSGVSNAAVGEWSNIIKFLGVGSAENLTKKTLQSAMHHVPTSPGHHNETISNYQEIQNVLMGTEFEALLH